MKLIDKLLIPLAFVFLIIGLYEMMALGPENGYWAIMLAIALFFMFQFRKKKA
jgi:uncharacterized membrane protein